MRPLVVLNVVGLTPSLLGDNTPRLAELARTGFQARVGAVFPAVTCTVQSSILTASLPREHGVVGNGWYFRDLSQVWLWRQSNHLVHGEKVWERGRRRASEFTCAKLFWWFNMYSGADWSVTPLPAYFADGRKAPDVYSEPADLRSLLVRELGPFPLFQFWGPGASIASTEWIARASRLVLERHRPTLTLVYLPHLDYDFQRYGPDDPRSLAAVREVDRVAGELIDAARESGAEVIALSEYGITGVTGSVSLNRELRRAGYLRVHEALNGELLDPGASRAFAVCDHQIAHVYVQRPTDVAAVRELLESLDGVERVLDHQDELHAGLRHERSGELVVVAAADRWFDYYYWLDEARAPDFARTVDIHQKPGYDPVELFLDPAKPLVKARVLTKVLAKKLGLRTLLDVIPLDTSLVRGSHGRLPDDPRDGPVLISSSKTGETSKLEMTQIADLMLETIFAGE